MVRRQRVRLRGALPRARVAPWLALILAFGFSVRGIGIGAYPKLIYDEYYYVPAAYVLLGRTPPIQVADATPYIDPNLASHPPLAKEWIALAIWLFGPHPWAWRLAPALLGAMTPALAYWIAQTLWKDRAAALWAAFLMAGEGLAVSLSHVALLDSIEFPLGLAATAWALWLAEEAEAGRYHGWGWLGEGMVLGMAVAAKWSGALTVLVVWVIAGRTWTQVRGWRRRLGLAIAHTFLPLAVYMASYVYAWPGGFGQWWLPPNPLKAVWVLQWTMFQNMWAFRFFNPGESSPWSWVGLPRPLQLVNWVQDGHEVLLWTLSDPLWTWFGMVALAALAYRGLRDPALRWPAGILATWFAVAWGAWCVTPRSHFYYYFLPALPPLLLAMGWALGALGRAGRWRRWLRPSYGLLLGLVLLSEAYVLPIAAGFPIPLSWIQNAYFLPQWNPKSSPSPRSSTRSPGRREVNAHALPVLRLSGQQGSGFSTRP